MSCPRLRFRNISAHDHLPDFFLIYTERAARVGPCVFRIVEVAPLSVQRNAENQQQRSLQKNWDQQSHLVEGAHWAQCGKVLVQEPCEVSLTSRIQQSIVVTCNSMVSLQLCTIA